MLEISTISELQKAIRAEKAKGRSIGFVPTMGYFHEGHLTLMREAARRSDVVVVSIFVNPIQFGPHEDLDKYPRDIDRDRNMARESGVAILFTPTAEEMYPEGYGSYVEVVDITGVLCGKSRPGHFTGVATVVTKLLNIVQPDRALFGEKDWQQLAVIKKLVADLNINVEIIGVPTVREEDGLAMSSRNIYLTPQEREAALVLSQSLKLAQDLVHGGETSVERMLTVVKEAIFGQDIIELEYLEICDPGSLKPLVKIESEVLIAIAARAGKARLIDNALIQPELEIKDDLL